MDLLRHLRFFVAVAEEGHFGNAAIRLEMTQPPVSQGLRRLERELGVELIRRAPHGAELTAAGRELLPRARVLIDDADRFTGEARRLREHADVLRCGLAPDLDPSIAAQCAAALAGLGSQQRHRISVAPVVDLVDDVRKGLLDLAIVEHPCVRDGLESGPVARIDRTFLVPAGHPVAAAKRPTVRMLHGLALAHSPRAANPPAFDLLIDTLHVRGLDPAILPVRAPSELVAAVAGGEAFAVAPAPGRLGVVAGIETVSMISDDVPLRLLVIRRPKAQQAPIDALESALWKLSR
ncbi:DNA-binding transcriptional LysR family regulator [Williamsia limnetica]|uniref:DNA-binding transcriptional LysR family regulator n=1 Tax=Williamsia limnetica TaxID=882452 RepID=A0A318RNX3_WILLI|nr:LysR family transcriptional regulator [Williamsia limnetica]PYE20304.1 DNA-binding transcriptional LysR family regulator [Williamsia limnetica]